MLAIISAILMTLSMVGETPVDFDEAGMMPEVVVTAPRYTEEEIANSGVMPEIIVVADRGTRSISDLALVRLIRRELSLRSFHRTYIVRIESRTLWFYN
jgi:hypothetical protein